MRVGLFDAIRVQSLRLIFDKNQAFFRLWNREYGPSIAEELNPSDPERIRDRLLKLGENFRPIFRDAAKDVRGGNSPSEAQAAMSISGSSWERLVTWYTNALGCGTNFVALNQRGQTQHLPDNFRDAFKVTINNNTVSSDLDVVLISWIGAQNDAWMQDEFDTENSHDMAKARNRFRDLFEQNPDQFAVCVLSTKTNWNDSIQTPMLWNLIFTHGFFHPLVNVGRNQCSPEMYGYFSYGFATVPSNKVSNYKPTSAPVIRASTMTAGSYWGLEGDETVRMRPLSEVFSNRTRLPTGMDVGRHFGRFISEDEGLEAFGLCMGV
jgi:hypothetical protein